MRRSLLSVGGQALVAVILAVVGAVSPAPAQVASDAPTLDGAAIDASQSVRRLVAKYLEFRGPAYAQLQTVHERFYVETRVGRQSGGLWLDRDGRMRRETSAAGVRDISVATPDSAWRIDDGAAPHDVPGGSERSRRYAALAFGDALSGRDGAAVTLGGDTELLDKTWTVLRVSFGDADAYEALIDPSDGLLCCYRITEGGQTRLELFGDWRLVDGVRMPFMQLTRTSADVQAQIGMIELNRPFDPSLFQRPTGAGG